MAEAGSAASGGASVPMQRRPAAASQVSLQQAAASPDARAALKQRMKADWCHVGAAAELRRLDPTRKAVSGTVAGEASEVLADGVNEELMREAIGQAHQRWVTELMKRSDPRAQALADFLIRDEASRVRLQARARSSSDPMLTELAMLRPCSPRKCQNVEASQWSRLEPANVQAWATLLSPPGGAQRTQQGYVLERINAAARYSRSYEREALEILKSVVQSDAPGLQSAAEVEAFMTLRVQWGGLQGFHPLIAFCRARLGEPGVADRCAALAELLWRDGDGLERSDAIKLMRATLPARPALRTAWESRAQSFEAFGAWQSNGLDRWWQRLVPNAEPVAAPCQFLAEQRQLMDEFVGRSEWESAQDEMRKVGVDEAALAIQARRGRPGRSLLDPSLD